MAKTNPHGMTDQMFLFCQEYVRQGFKDATGAYRKTHPNCSEKAAPAAASRLLKNVKVRKYLEEVQAKASKRRIGRKKAVATKSRAKKSSKKNPRKNPRNGVGNNADLIPGNPGNSGGKPGRSGRLPSKIREAARLAFAERLEVLTDIADGKKDERAADRIAAMKVLADTGGVDKIAITVDEQPEEAHTPERAARLWAMLQRIKSVAALEKLMVDHAKKQMSPAVSG